MKFSDLIFVAIGFFITCLGLATLLSFFYCGIFSSCSFAGQSIVIPWRINLLFSIIVTGIVVGYAFRGEKIIGEIGGAIGLLIIGGIFVVGPLMAAYICFIGGRCRGWLPIAGIIVLWFILLVIFDGYKKWRERS